ncbi:related to MFS transporter [Fusarium fujikuroi]|nr:related to MFS transporter [Fusarium fujikuroi]
MPTLWRTNESGLTAEVEFPPPSNTDRQQAFGNGRKYLILFIVSWNCLIVTFSSTSLLVATPEIASDLKTTTEIINATNAGVLVAMGCSSMIWSPLAELIGRRHSYNAALLFMLATSIGTAVATNLPGFTALRVLSGLTGTYFMVTGQTIIADIYEPLVRGRAVGFMQVGSVAGSAIGPCISGIIITFSHWRSIYWLQSSMAGLGLILSFYFIPNIESEVEQLHGKLSASERTLLGVLKRFNPSKILKQFLRPQVFLADLTCGFLAISQYGLLTCVRHVITPRYHIATPLISGLFYIAPGMGFVVGSVLGGRMSDHAVKRYIAKRKGSRLPKDRLNSGLVYLLAVLPISLLIYGWSLEKKFGGLALPIVMAFWIGVGLMGAWNGLNTYTAEVFPAERSEVVCSKYVLQYAFGATISATIVPLLDATGVGWTFTICTFLKIFGGIIVIFLARIVPNTGVWEYKS